MYRTSEITTCFHERAMYRGQRNVDELDKGVSFNLSKFDSTTAHGELVINRVECTNFPVLARVDRLTTLDLDYFLSHE